MSEWWCQYCNSVVNPVDVTYEETHDRRSGGCGGRVFGGSEKVQARITADARIAHLEAAIAAAPHVCCASYYSHPLNGRYACNCWKSEV